MAKSKQTQVDKFKQAARELETDDDERRFDEKLEKIARSPVKGKKAEKAADEEG